MADDFQEDIRISELPEADSVDKDTDFLAVVKPSTLYTSGFKSFKVKASKLSDGGGGASSADDVTYDNSASGLEADNVQEALDELAQSSGGSTVEVTQVQTTGTKIATITVDSVDTDLYAPQDGGSGGHTIVDSEGVSLEQRTSLQFNGAYSEDNSTDDTTEVNVVREMTKAEFDELTEEEKTGFINITDITGGNDDRFQPVIYSETEREIGVWTDGKPLYEKTIYVDSFPNNTSKNLSTPTNLDMLIDSFGFMKSTTLTGYFRTLPFAAGGTNDVRVDLNAGTLRVVTFSDWSGYEGYITIRYTKSTDQAGSGQWTPQGVPAVHYSTDEHIIGTWVDGSTLYEKTVSFSVTDDNTFDYAINISGVDSASIMHIVDGFFLCGVNRRELNFEVAENYMAYTNLDYYVSDNKYHIGGLIKGYSGVCYATIRYTKSST